MLIMYYYLAFLQREYQKNSIILKVNYLKKYGMN